MKTVINPPKAQWAKLLERPSAAFDDIKTDVASILSAVKERGDAALRHFTATFDGATIGELQVGEEALLNAADMLKQPLKDAIALAAGNIKRFHEAQQEGLKKVDTMPGVSCWRKSVAIPRVGLYIPGGTAPLFSTILMLGIPARLAGCKEIVLCTPPRSGGSIHPAILYCANLLGIKKVFRVGGSQAIGAMAFGTESIPKVDKVFGPGNAYVTAAKMLVCMEGVAVDMPAGPTELMIFADANCPPAFVAADILSQAEHGPDSQVVLVAETKAVIDPILREVEIQLAALPRRDIAVKALGHSLAVVLESDEEVLSMINMYAPEHLILAVEAPQGLAVRVKNAGSVFMGNYSPEAAGDYASGTNHTLPTSGHARAFSGVSLDSFVKKITFQQITPEGLAAIGPAIEEMAAAEDLIGHKRAVSLRLNRTQ